MSALRDTEYRGKVIILPSAKIDAECNNCAHVLIEGDVVVELIATYFPQDRKG